MAVEPREHHPAGGAFDAASDLRHMRGRPFGVDEDGRPIDHGSGKLIVGAIDFLQDCVAERVRREATADLSDAAIRQAQDEALDRLVAMLNDAMVDERYRVTREYLLNRSNRYSYEFRYFLAEYCRVISGEPDFFFKQGARNIPPTLVHLTRPLGVEKTFGALPGLTAKYVRTDIRVVRTTPSSAILQWRAVSQLPLIPEEIREGYIRYACRTYQGTFAAIPSVAFGRRPAEVREVRCQADGAECCEWEFTWEERASDRRRWRPLLGGLALSAVVATAVFRRLPGSRWLAPVLSVLLPSAVAQSIALEQGARSEIARLDEALQEQRTLSEAQYDESERANANLQLANVMLTHKISELTTLHEVAQAVSTTLDLDELLDRSLAAVVTHLRFERAMVLLVDEERGVLGHGRSIGGAPDTAEVIASLSQPLERTDSHLVETFLADGAKIFRDLQDDAVPANQVLARRLGVTSFLGTPLITKGRRLGILAVDNGLSGQPIRETDAALLSTVGNQIANAVESAHLYQLVENDNRLLEERVRLRTIELANATTEAQEARAAAEAASATKSAFLANMSHELRTPLNAIIGYSEMLQEDARDDGREELAADLQKIRGAGTHLLGLINDVLDLSKIEANKMDLYPQTFDLRPMIDDVIATIQPLIDKNGNSLDIVCPDDPGSMHADLTRVRQVLFNLLSNASKFTDHGTIRVDLARETSDDGADWIVFRVTDSGIGMSQSQIDRLFQPFVQADESTTRKYGGTGLGLALSQRFSQMMGGEISVTSTFGEGSAFTVRLPAQAARVPETPPERVSRNGSAGLPNGDTVLVVDDDAEMRALLERLLEPEGIKVVGTASGEEGVRLAQSLRPAVITLDVKMPSMDGWSVLAALKADPSTASIPVVLLTVVDDRSLGYSFGAADYLLKPVSRDRLMDVLGKYLRVPAV